MSMDAITRMMNSFKHFEKKLDKLQDDVNNQGKTLLDLRVMMMNLSAGHIVSPDAKSDDTKRNKTEAIQFEYKAHHSPVNEKTNKHVPIKPLPDNKIQVQKRRMSSLESPGDALSRKLDASQIHVQRHRKADANRKGNAARLHKKKSDKKKPVKSN